ncbi:MAG: ABC transporter ATP-binding protein [Nocardioidaceae bacterium]|nr:ABC transporter ATP-binding protein [Nocardioidaceae bacterium]
MLQADDIGMTFQRGSRRVTALEGVSLTFARGQFSCILGPSGSGKSTLLHILGGFEQPTTGDITLDDCRVERPTRRLGMVFQHASLFPWRNIERNVAWPIEANGGSRKQACNTARELLGLVGLRGFERAYPAELSGGMRQRAALARTLAMEPEVLLMDEPFGALDAQTRELMQEELSRIWQESRLTVVFVTHDISEAVFLGDRVVLLTARPGRVAHDITIDLERPRDGETKKSKELLDYHNDLWDLLRAEIDNADAAVVGVTS